MQQRSLVASTAEPLASPARSACGREMPQVAARGPRRHGGRFLRGQAASLSP
jgi:hypothetical protein